MRLLPIITQKLRKVPAGYGVIVGDYPNVPEGMRSSGPRLGAGGSSELKRHPTVTRGDIAHRRIGL